MAAETKRRARDPGEQRHRLNGRGFDGDFVAADAEIVNARSLARIEASGLQRVEQRVWVETLRLDHDEAAEGVALAVVEMRVVAGDGRQPPALVGEPVQQIEAVAAVDLDCAAVIVDFDRVGGVERAPVLLGQLRPGGMGDGDEGAGGAGAARQFGPALGRRRGSEIERQADGEDVPQLAADVPIACSSAPIRVVKSLARNARVSAIGQPKRSRKCSESWRKS